jgi:hypothetical protein
MLGDRPPKPRVVDVLRETIEAELADGILRVFVDGLQATRIVIVNGAVEYVPDHAARHAAARELLDRAYGKPQAGVTVSGDYAAPLVVDLTNPSMREAARLISDALAAEDAGPAHGDPA